MDNQVTATMPKHVARLVADCVDHYYDTFVNAGATPKELAQLNLQLRGKEGMMELLK
jgi:hypothetical protein